MDNRAPVRKIPPETVDLRPGHTVDIAAADESTGGPVRMKKSMQAPSPLALPVSAEGTTLAHSMMKEVRNPNPNLNPEPNRHPNP